MVLFCFPGEKTEDEILPQLKVHVNCFCCLPEWQISISALKWSWNVFHNLYHYFDMSCQYCML